jgi:hypothetical protein
MVQREVRFLCSCYKPAYCPSYKLASASHWAFALLYTLVIKQYNASKRSSQPPFHISRDIPSIPEVLLLFIELTALSNSSLVEDSTGSILAVITYFQDVSTRFSPDSYQVK